jgi:hypothetical protein
MSVKIYKLGPKCWWNILIVADNTAVKFIRVHIRDVNRFWSSRRKLKSNRQINADALARHPLRPGIWGPLKAILLHVANRLHIIVFFLIFLGIFRWVPNDALQNYKRLSYTGAPLSNTLWWHRAKKDVDKVHWTFFTLCSAHIELGH